MGHSENLLKILLSLAASLFLFNALLLTPFSALLLPSLGGAALLISLILWGKWGSLLLGLSCEDLLELFGAGALITLPLLYAAGALRLVSPWALRLWILLPFLVFPFLGEVKRALWQEGKRFLHRPLWVWILLLPAFLYAALPPTFYDTLVYHLAVPNHILLHRGFAATPNWVYSNSSNFYEVLLLLPLSLGERVPGLFHFFLGVLFLLTVVDFGRKELRLERGYLALLLLTLPMTLFLLGSLKNDLPAALFLFLAFRALRKGRWERGALAGALAVGVKYFSALPLFVALILALRPPLPRLRRVAAAGGVALLVLLPLFLKNALLTGNPIYPFLGNLFPSPQWDPSRSLVMARDVGRIVSGFRDLLRLPYDLSYRFYGFGGGVGPLFLALLPLLLVSRRRGLPRDLLLFPMAVLLLGTPFTGSLRFLFIAFIILSLPVAYLLEERPTLLLRLLFLGGVLFHSALGLVVQERVFSASSLWSGSKTEREFLEERFPASALYRWINKSLPRTSRILILGEGRSFSLHRPYQIGSALDYLPERDLFDRCLTSEDYLQGLKGRGYTHLFVHFGELERVGALYKGWGRRETDLLLSLSLQKKPLWKRGKMELFEIP